jgi:tRNA(Arg) A34 adenosine deaminase TadA
MAKPDPKLMQRAVEKATESMLSGQGGPFGAVVVRDGVVIAESGNQEFTTHDPTAHAEIQAIRQACQKIETSDLQGCVIYSSAEPCPMCLAACYWANLEAVYFAASVDETAKFGFEDKVLYKELTQAFDERQLPIVQVRCDDDLEPLELWDELGRV